MTDNTPSVFTIDEGNLHGEWLKQPSLTRKAGVRVADAKHAVSQAKAAHAVALAEAARRIRRDPEKYGLKSKPAEDAIKSAAILDPDARAALDAVHDAEHALDVCEAESAAMSDRRRALERLVELLAIDYYAEPRAKGPVGREVVANGNKAAARGPVRTPGNTHAVREKVPVYAAAYEQERSVADQAGTYAMFAGPTPVLGELLETVPHGEEPAVVFRFDPDGTETAVFDWSPDTETWVEINPAE